MPSLKAKVRTQMPVRLPQDLYEALKKKALRDNVSMNSLITRAVENFFRDAQWP